MNAWFADVRALVDAVMPTIDAVTSRSLARLRALEEDPATGLPAALVLATSVPIALLIGVPTAGVGLGAALGLVIAASATLRARVAARRNAEAVAAAIAEAWADADHRVMLVTKQYEWAVNDVANLRDALQRTRAQSAGQSWRTRPAAPAWSERPRSAARLVRYLRESDPATTLRFGAEDVQPEQLRVVEGGNVVAISARSLEAASGADTTFAIRVSEQVADAFSEGSSAIAIEALIDERWQPAEVRPAVMPHPPTPVRAQPADVPAPPSEMRALPVEVKDKRGRVWRSAPAEEDALV